MENKMIEAVKPFAGLVNHGDFVKLGIKLRDGRWVQYLSGTQKFISSVGQEMDANPADVETVEWLRTGETFQGFVDRQASDQGPPASDQGPPASDQGPPASVVKADEPQLRETFVP